MPIKQSNYNSVSCGIRMTSPIRRLHSSAMHIYFILEQRLVLRFLLGTRSQSSHVQHIKDCDPPAFLALGFYMTPRVLVDSNGIMLTIGTFQVSGLLLGNGNSCPADFFRSAPASVPEPEWMLSSLPHLQWVNILTEWTIYHVAELTKTDRRRCLGDTEQPAEKAQR